MSRIVHRQATQTGSFLSRKNLARMHRGESVVTIAAMARISYQKYQLHAVQQFECCRFERFFQALLLDDHFENFLLSIQFPNIFCIVGQTDNRGRDFQQLLHYIQQHIDFSDVVVGGYKNYTEDLNNKKATNLIAPPPLQISQINFCGYIIAFWKAKCNT